MKDRQKIPFDNFSDRVSFDHCVTTHFLWLCCAGEDQRVRSARRAGQNENVAHEKLSLYRVGYLHLQSTGLSRRVHRELVNLVVELLLYRRIILLRFLLVFLQRRCSVTFQMKLEIEKFNIIFFKIEILFAGRSGQQAPGPPSAKAQPVPGVAKTRSYQTAQSLTGRHFDSKPPTAGQILKEEFGEEKSKSLNGT